MNKKILLIPLLLLSAPFFELASAHCPLCTAGAGAGVAAARFLGVDDSIVGLFLGALIISTALWLNKALKKKYNVKINSFLIILVSFLSFAIPFYTAGIITNFDMVRSMPEVHSVMGLGVYGIDKLLFGMLLGSAVICGAFSLSDYIKNKKGRVLYPYQGISFMAISLAVFSIVLWIITR